MRELVAAPQIKYTLTVLSGADRGAVYELVSGRITLGRGSENTIVIRDDPKVSRQHAIIVVGPNTVQIDDTSDRNKVLVNNEVIKSGRLTSGMIIQLGETKLMFKTGESPALTTGRERTPSPRTSKGPRPKGNRTVFYTIVGTILLLFVWVANQKSGTGKSNQASIAPAYRSTVKTDQEIVNKIEAADMRAGKNTPQYNAAQDQFLKGFRDYEDGQYSRAIESFSACLTLFPRHPKCGLYLSLAQNRFQELIQYELNRGSKDKAQGQYSACAAAYRNVMFMVRDQLVTSDQKTYNLAQAGHNACIALGGHDD